MDPKPIPWHWADGTWKVPATLSSFRVFARPQARSQGRPVDPQEAGRFRPVAFHGAEGRAKDRWLNHSQELRIEVWR